MRRADVGWGIGLGVAVPALGYLLLMLLRVTVTDPMLLGLLALPALVAALVFASPASRGRAPGLLTGAVIGMALLVVAVGGGISLLASLLSDPG